MSHHGGGSGSGERWSDSGCIFRDHRISRQTYVSCKEKERVKMIPVFWAKHLEGWRSAEMEKLQVE